MFAAIFQRLLGRTSKFDLTEVERSMRRLASYMHQEAKGTGWPDELDRIVGLAATNKRKFLKAVCDPGLWRNMGSLADWNGGQRKIRCEELDGTLTMRASCRQHKILMIELANSIANAGIRHRPSMSAARLFQDSIDKQGVRVESALQ